MYAILPAEPGDAAVIHEMKMRAFAEEGRLSQNVAIPPLMEEVAAIELDIRNHTVLTALDAERIIGSARGIVTGAVCTIRAVCVEPTHQGLGIGAALLRAVEEAHPGIERFELTTNTLVPGNVAFYERRGYQVTELTRYTDKIVLAQMRKYARARARRLTLPSRPSTSLRWILRRRGAALVRNPIAHCVQNVQMASTSKYRVALALIFITPALWAVNYLVARIAPGVIEPHALAFLRWLIASLLFSLGHWGEIWEARDEMSREWMRYLVLGALGMWICGAWVYIGGRTTAAINISLIYSISPVLIALAAALWLKERISVIQGIGVALALAGVLHVVLKGEWTALGDVTLVPGDGWIVAATISWAAYSLLMRKWPSKLGASARLSVIAMAGVLVMLPFAIFEAMNNPLPALTLTGIGLVLAVAVFPGYGAYLAYSVMQRELGVARVGVVLYLGPIYAAVMAWLVLGEALHAYHAWAMAMVLPGIYLVNRKHGS